MLYSRRHYLTVLLFVSVFIMLSGVPSRSSNAAPCIIPRVIKNMRPDPKGVPTRVSAGIYMIDIMKIDDVSQSYTADVYISLLWRDMRLSAKARGGSLAGCNVQRSDIWHPDVRILNWQKIEKSFGDEFRIDDEGNVLYTHRMLGVFTSQFDLRAFPFDSQVLPIKVVSVRYGPEEVLLEVDRFRTGRMDVFSLAGWSIEPGDTHITTQHIAPQDRDLAMLNATYIATRDEGFYIWKVFMPLTFIVFMAGTVFVIIPIELGPRFGVSTASIFTLIAFQFSLGYLLPRVSYLTRADKFLIGSSVLVFLALAEAILTSRLAKLGNERLALKINQWARYIYPVLFSGVFLVSLVL